MSGRIQWKPLIISLAVTLGIGLLSGFLTSNAMNDFNSLNKPPLAPPAVLFPIVWTVLYILMGISAYLIYVSDSEYRQKALNIYILQLFFNFTWTLIFFGLEQRLFAFIWLILLWLLILEMILVFKKVNPIAAYLQIPYLLWVTFAGYLNLAIYLLNK